MVHKQATESPEPIRTVLSDKTYSRIREMLLSNEIAPGKRVNIDALARKLDVSQTPVREALARLEADDLVSKQPLRGYHATQLLTIAQLEDLFQFRTLIEPWAATKAARNIDKEGSRRIRQELLKGKSAEKQAESDSEPNIDDAASAMSQHDARFHTLIAELSGSEFVRDAYVRTHCHLHMLRLYRVLKSWSAEASADTTEGGDLFYLYYTSSSGFLALREHEEIAKAVISGEEHIASALMLQHIDNSLSRFVTGLSVIQKDI